MENSTTEPKTWKQSFVDYCMSNKGRELTMSISMMYILVMMVMSLALVLGEILGAGLTRRTGLLFFIGLFTLSIASMITLLVLGSRNSLTIDDHYKDQRSTTFVRAGMIGLGTGGIVYFVVGVAEFLDLNQACNDFYNLTYELAGITFILFQMALLVKYSRLRINKCVTMIVAARFMTAQIVATNGCLWMALVGLEAQIEASHSSGEGEHASNDSRPTQAPKHENHTSSTAEECKNYHELENLLGPYAFPMLIEYCVVSATMILVIWENSGIGYRGNPEASSGRSSESDEINSDEGIVMRASRPSVTSLGGVSFHKRHSTATLTSTGDLSSLFSPSYEIKSTQHYNSFSGFVLGWIIICLTSGTVILSLYRLYTDGKTADGDPEVTTVTYGLNAALSVVCILACVLTFFKLTKLTFEDEEALETILNERGKEDVEYASDVKEKIENQLGVLTLLCLISWKIFSIIAAFDQDDLVLFIEGVISILFGMTQTLFLSYAQKKRTKTREQLLEKPGRQGLEFLRLTNFALWLNNTSLLKHPNAKVLMNATYGEMEWAVLSNVFQPLSILYYFHSMISITEAVHQAYSSKFVGVVRHSKRRPTMAQIAEEDHEDFD